MNALRLSLAALVAAFSLPVAAQLFKCTAADGKVAYQDSPCPTTAAQKQMSQIQSDVRDAAASGVALMDVDAAARAFGESRGSVAVLVIYSSKCGLCQQVMPELSALARDLEGRGVQWKAFSVDALEDQPQLPDFLAQTRAPFAAVALRPWAAGGLSRAFGAQGVTIPESWSRPFIAVRDRTGRVLFQSEGVGQLSQVRGALDAALAS
jgi:hypothetical protein